ncbi:hypothetical protein [Streptomyces atratus]|uniref:hypothetical protein n=1 Tax=Streptomyces atratus TaxID=1893 RepID=UPI0033E1ECD8
MPLAVQHAPDIPYAAAPVHRVAHPETGALEELEVVRRGGPLAPVEAERPGPVQSGVGDRPRLPRRSPVCRPAPGDGQILREDQQQRKAAPVRRVGGPGERRALR